MSKWLIFLMGSIWLSSALAGVLDTVPPVSQLQEEQAARQKAERLRVERIRRQQEEDARQAELARRQQIERDRIAREQAAEALRQQTAREQATRIDMVSLPAGSFVMGCQSGRDSSCYGDESPAHNVSLSAFEMGKTEVTQGQWKAVMGSNPSNFKDCGDTCPVEQVSWDDVQTFIQKLNAQTGKAYRLPSEAEWEYACRANQSSNYCGGNDVNSVAWYGDNSGNKTHPVGGKQANAWGLYDMSGSVWEWVQDWKHDNYNGAPSNGSAWEGSGTFRVLRGGSWYSIPRNSRAANRDNGTPAERGRNVGFRLARTLP